MTVVVDFEEQHHHARVEEIQRLAFHRGDEVRMTRRLRNVTDGFSLVASVSGILFGHALIIPTSLANLEVENPLRFAALALLSVDPDQQGRGIGLKLIQETIIECRKSGYDAVVVAMIDDYWREAGFEEGAPFNIFFEHAQPSDPSSAVFWLTKPQRLDLPIYLDYPEPYSHGK